MKVTVHGMEEIEKQTETVRQKMRELNMELGKLDQMMVVTAEISQPSDESAADEEPTDKEQFEAWLKEQKDNPRHVRV